MNYLFSFIYCFFWYTSILAGYMLLYCPLFPVLIISHRLYRYLTDYIFRFWELYPTALLHQLGTEFIVTGDPVLHNDRAVIIMNHRTRTDWNYFWPIIYHALDTKIKHNVKFVLKDPIKKIPGPGWVMMLTCFLYIRRHWEEDKNTIEKWVKYIKSLNKNYQILIFPEGTDLTEQTREKSHKFAEKYKFKKYYNVLHPRTAGFCFLVSQLQKYNHFDAIYDMTLAYPDDIPQTELKMLKGCIPRKVHCNIRRYSAAEVPRNEEDLKTFLINRWEEKEAKIEEFDDEKHFNGRIIKRHDQFDLIIPLIFWTLLPFITFYLFLNNHYFRLIVLYHTGMLLITSFIFGNFINFEMYLYYLKRNIFRWGR